MNTPSPTRLSPQNRPLCLLAAVPLHPRWAPQDASDQSEAIRALTSLIIPRPTTLAPGLSTRYPRLNRRPIPHCPSPHPGADGDDFSGGLVSRDALGLEVVVAYGAVFPEMDVGAVCVSGDSVMRVGAEGARDQGTWECSHTPLFGCLISGETSWMLHLESAQSGPSTLFPIKIVSLVHPLPILPLHRRPPASPFAPHYPYPQQPSPTPTGDREHQHPAANTLVRM